MNSKKNDLIHKDIKGLTPLHYAGLTGNLEMAEALLEHLEKDSLNLIDESGWTPMHYATYCGNLNIVTLLLTHGAPIEQSNLKFNDICPLQAAVRTGQLDITKLLIDYGADVDRKTPFENNLLYLAVKNRQFSTANYLLDSTICFDRLNDTEKKTLVDIYINKN